MKPFFLSTLLLIATSATAAELPVGTPAEQVAAIRAKLDAERAAYIQKLQKATTTEQRNQLVKEAPNAARYAEQMIRIAADHSDEAAAIDALLWVIGNTNRMTGQSQNAQAKAMLLDRYAESDRLTPFAVALSFEPSVADEASLRQLLERNKSDKVRAAAGYALARQLIGQADMIDVHHIRLETASSDEARRDIDASLDKDFGQATADRLRTGSPKALTAEADRLLSDIVANPKLAAADWPVGRKSSPLGELVPRELDALRTLRPGSPAPAINGTDVNNQPVSLSSQRGKVILLTFSGQWCTACRGMYPLERELTAQHAGHPFTLFGVNSDESRDVAAKAIAAEKMTWPVLWDGGSTEGPVATRWNVRGWPLVVLIDHTGTIRYRFNGAPVSEILTPLVDRLVNEAESAGVK